MDDSCEFIIFLNIFLSVKLCICFCLSINEYEDFCNLFKWVFFYNLKLVLINIIIVNLCLLLKFIDDDVVILWIYF